MFGWLSHLADVVQTDVEVVLHRRVLHLVLLAAARVAADIEGLGAEGRVAGPEAPAQAGAETAQRGERVVRLHPLHVVVEEGLRINIFKYHKQRGWSDLVIDLI